MVAPTNQNGETEMIKKEIYKVRAQVHGAMSAANKSKTPYSPLIRMEWKKYGYIPVTAFHLA
jgi:hypothetical protein